jgi:hypothetical protein
MATFGSGFMVEGSRIVGHGEMPRGQVNDIRIN